MRASLSSFLRRYAFPAIVTTYALGILFLHALHLFPRPGLYDLSQLIGATQVVLEGRVVNFPLTRWGRTEFLLEARAQPLSAFHGRAAVKLSFPSWDLSPGDRIRLRGWLYPPRTAAEARGFDEKGYWASRQTYAMMRVYSPASFEVMRPASPYSIRFWAWRFHQRSDDFWFNVLPNDEAALLSGITLGSRGIVSARIKNACIRAGVYHILVVSGQKIALLVAAGLLVLRMLRIPRQMAFWISMPLILFYAQAVGADPPVMRASIMALVILGVMALRRDVPRCYPLFLAAGWILLREPEALLGASFQLSFGATASILALLPFFESRFSKQSRGMRWFLQAGGMGLAVHLGIWPLLLGYFHQLSLVGFLANWTLFPFSGVLMIYGLLLGSWGVLAPGQVPEPLINGMRFLLQATLKAIEGLSRWKFAAVVLHAPPWPVCAVYYLTLFGILFLSYRRKYGQIQPSDPIRRHRL